MSHPRRRLGVLLLVVLLVGCGVRAQGEPEEVSPSDVPPGLLVPTAMSSAPSSPATAPAGLYLVRVARLERVTVAVSRRDVRVVLEALFAGPSEVQRASGQRSAIRSDSRLVDVRVEGGVATVSTNDSFGALTGPEQILAVAQVVLTATEVPGVHGVMIALNGRPVVVPDVTGALVNGPARRADFLQLVDR